MWRSCDEAPYATESPAKGTPFMQATNTRPSPTTGAQTPAMSSVGAIHVETSARELRLALSGLLLALTLAALDQNIVATAPPDAW